MILLGQQLIKQVLLIADHFEMPRRPSGNAAQHSISNEFAILTYSERNVLVNKRFFSRSIIK